MAVLSYISLADDLVAFERYSFYLSISTVALPTVKHCYSITGVQP